MVQARKILPALATLTPPIPKRCAKPRWPAVMAPFTPDQSKDRPPHDIWGAVTPVSQDRSVDPNAQHPTLGSGQNRTICSQQWPAAPPASKAAPSITQSAKRPRQASHAYVTDQPPTYPPSGFLLRRPDMRAKTTVPSKNHAPLIIQ